MPTATSYSVLNPGYTVAPISVTVAPVYPTYPGGASPSGAIAPTGYSTGSAPSYTSAPAYTGSAARTSGTVISALAVAFFGAVVLM